jgi:hypothetical protein
MGLRHSIGEQMLILVNVALAIPTVMNVLKMVQHIVSHAKKDTIYLIHQLRNHMELAL